MLKASILTEEPPQLADEEASLYGQRPLGVF